MGAGAKEVFKQGKDIVNNYLQSESLLSIESSRLDCLLYYFNKGRPSTPHTVLIAM